MSCWKEMPGWDYRLWTDADADVELATLPRLAKEFARAKENPAERSDILRLALVLRHGGVYVDVDFQCLKPLDLLNHHFSFYTGFSNVAAFEINNGIFAASPGHPLLAFLCEHVAIPWADWGKEDVDPKEAVARQLAQSGFLGVAEEAAFGSDTAFLGTTGPGFFTRGLLRAIRAHKLGGEDDVVFPPEVFYPLPNSLRHLPAAEREEYCTPATFAVHHWCRTWCPEASFRLSQDPVTRGGEWPISDVEI